MLTRKASSGNTKTCWWDDVLWALTWSAVCKRFPGGSDGKGSACNAGDPGWISGWGRPPGERNGYPLGILAWGIPRTEEPPPWGSQEIWHNWVTNTFTFTFVAERGEEVALSSQKDLSPSLARDFPHPTFLDEFWRRSPGTRLPTGAKEFKAGKSWTNLTFPSHMDCWNCEQKVWVLPDIFAMFIPL